ncbi:MULTISPECIES: AbgT family transporter [Pseudonocardia]|uniref:p-aminobenzoyl-glutamate transport protein n=2 Tax=Pseudonocardia TaxID=1847 RepID=A0A1Y2N0B4_PSEAH|nr:MULTISPECIES: AbgT family transporter [Pseudonocardia]OSY40913.1 p-aminobenzoyl-glutamate transport protein [Pseudonocardia autotrophica]TDN73957.1 aminobenzoyl-glutamate transport protein [Pseudonocardia autotrophica]BBG04711.1 aminobenzoyl-glutamate transporter [Pseudonocardia autotrophica]GEC28748.1 aminobenzoyl-glutamate transporter [Pseudonocardia saturnea]
MPAAPDTGGRLPSVVRALDVVERLGNRLPHPFWLFWVLSALLGLLSLGLAAAGIGATDPGSGGWVPVRNLLSGDGLAFAVGAALDSYRSFPPLVTIMVVIMGVALAERTGLLRAALRASLANVPASLVVFVLAFLGTVSTVASAAAYVILVPLGGIAFQAVGRSPILGVVVAYTSIASGYDANPVPTPNDVVFAGISTAAARIVDPDAVVTPLANWYFNIASALLLAAVITLVTELLLTRRDNLEPDEGTGSHDEGLDLSADERSGLRWAFLAVLTLLTVTLLLTAPAGAPLRGDGGAEGSPLMAGVAFLIAVVFGIGGIAFGIRTGVIRTFDDVPAIMAKGIVTVAPVLVFFFAISQFLAYFEWTNVGTLLSVATSDLLRDIGAPTWLVLLTVLGFLLVLNIVITSGTAMWAITAPVVVPMLMLLDVPPDTAQAVFRIADSGSTSISPMSPYFLLALGFLQRYRAGAGIGTLVSFTLPLALFMTAAWTVLFLVWWSLGIPLGPGAPVR